MAGRLLLNLHVDAADSARSQTMTATGPAMFSTRGPVARDADIATDARNVEDTWEKEPDWWANDLRELGDGRTVGGGQYEMEVEMDQIRTRA
jgi:hypothetical protein